MRFISREKSPGFVLKDAQVKIIETNYGNIPQRMKAAHIKFEPLGNPFKTAALPVVNYKDYASGKLDSDVAAKKLRSLGHKWTETDEEGNEVDVTEKVVIDFLFRHPKYGRDFIAIGGDGVEIVDTVIIPEGDGGFYCRLCEQHFDTVQGKDGHVTSSKKHKENLEKAGANALASIS